MIHVRHFLALWAVVGAASPAVLAQANRIAVRIDSSQSVVLPGRVSPFVSAANDKGAVDGGTHLSSLALVLKPSAIQQSGLDQLLLSQQDSTSPNYHRWLTPEQYADRFGASGSDVTKITEWLSSQGFSVDYVARSRNYVTFSGTAQQIANTFHTQIHTYSANGETHFSNAKAPSVPAALAGLVSGIRGLNDFRLKPRMKKIQPHLLFGGQELIAPTDFATIYDVNPLYNAGITGTGQKIVVVGQSAIVTTDITQFRARNALGSANLDQVLVPGSQNPGISQGDEEESDLDIEWSGAVAKGATIVFVYSTDVWSSLTYAIDQDLAPVLSISYGSCEEGSGPDVLESQRVILRQANAEGITIVAASGDAAAADCDPDYDNTDPAIAEGGLAVDSPASYPEVTGMGGTQFDVQGGGYFKAGNAVSYIPEVVWNDTLEVGQLNGGGGGASIYYTQPPWQNGIAPADGMRHVPDLSFPASNVVDPFFIYTSDPSSGFVGAGGIGGTSCAAPSMAGVIALLNQYLTSTGALAQAGLGNINPALYRLSQTQSSAFHDIVNGNNIVPCGAQSPNCSNGTMGWPATPGYDSASGLGSVDANNLVHAWSTALATGSEVLPSVGQFPVFETTPNSWPFTLTLTEEAGVATTLTGLTINGVSYTSQIPTLFGSAAIAARGSVSALITLQNLDVSSGPVNVVFTLSGMDAGGAVWNNTMTVPFSGPQTQLTIRTINNAASGQSVFAPGMLMGVYGAGFTDNMIQPSTVVPLPEYMAGFEAWVNYGPGFSETVSVPLMYVSPGQANVQLPYELPAGLAQLEIGNPYQSQTYNFTVADAAPGIFSYASGGGSLVSAIGSDSAHAGDTVAIYITGEGAVSPFIVDGSTPSEGRAPTTQQVVSITVDGVPVAQPFAYIGVPIWAIGVMQIDFKIPDTVQPGSRPVVVTIGSGASLPANITIVQ